MEKQKTSNSDESGKTPVTKNKKSPLWGKLLTILVLVVVGVAAVSLLPKGYSQDISVIGKGERVVVLYHDPFTVDSQQNMDMANEIRDKYEGRVKFVVADGNVEQGKKFTELYGVSRTAFVFFEANGEQVNILYGRHEPDALVKLINQTFKFE